MNTEISKPDLDSRENIEQFVDLFYERMLADDQLAPIFVNVAEIDLEVHLPHIKNYWRKLLLGERDYRRHTMNIHRQVHAKRSLTTADFDRWLAFFTSAVDDHYAGAQAERAKKVAASIAANMEKSLA